MRATGMNACFTLFLLTLSPLSHASISQASESPTREELRANYERVMKELSHYQESGNWLGAAQFLRREYDEPSNRQLRGSIAQPLSWTEALLGNTVDAIALSPQQLRPDASDKFEDIPENVRSLPFVQAISNAAADQQVVMINEAHHVSRHRANTLHLLEPLRKAGFKYLAVEALGKDTAALSRRGYPVRDSGSLYLSDPVFGSLIRRALELGYQLVGYEAIGSNSTAERETGQARNLAAILKEDPDARILVHAGYQHIEESGLMFGSPTMAQEFKRLTGIDPFTISQTKTTWRGPDEEFGPVYREALEVSGLDEPFVLVSEGTPYSDGFDKLDMVIFTPPTRLTDGRPNWLGQLPDRIRVVLPVMDSDVPRPWMVEARKSKESADAIPVDRIEIKPGATKEEIVLWLLPGSYDIQWKNVDGKVFHVDSVTPFVPPKRGSN